MAERSDRTLFGHGLMHHVRNTMSARSRGEQDPFLPVKYYCCNSICTAINTQDGTGSQDRWICRRNVGTGDIDRRPTFDNWSLVPGDQVRTPSHMVAPVPMTTVDVELALLKPDDLRPSSATVVAAPSVLVRLKGAINDQPVTGVRVVVGSHAHTQAPLVSPLGPLLTILPNDNVSWRIAAVHPVVRIYYKVTVQIPLMY
ncbi:unnamed protein product (mitochondrion) [Plasmodiophora brassicae]|uniref:Uncharacterized protein n=1 Tax=Plasmodiophora brassicae TaxID=37360 RepID=A0A3P3YKV2_PLABS|nr:unnamed protein product [Plasmodiophora brassicae]